MPHGGLRVASRPPRLQPGRAVPFITRIPYQVGLRREGLVKSPSFSSEGDGTRTRNHRIDRTTNGTDGCLPHSGSGVFSLAVGYHQNHSVAC